MRWESLIFQLCFILYEIVSTSLLAQKEKENCAQSTGYREGLAVRLALTHVVLI